MMTQAQVEAVFLRLEVPWLFQRMYRIQSPRAAEDSAEIVFVAQRLYADASTLPHVLLPHPIFHSLPVVTAVTERHSVIADPGLCSPCVIRQSGVRDAGTGSLPCTLGRWKPTQANLRFRVTSDFDLRHDHG